MAVVSLFADGKVIRNPCNASAGNLQMASRIQRKLDRLVASGLHTDWKSWYLRRSMVTSTCWFLMTSKHLDILAGLLQGKRVLEIAGGTGYLAAQMRLRGVQDYRAIDARCSYYNHKSINFGVEIDNFYSIPKEELQSYDIIVLTWPPYGDDLAHHVFRKMRNGQILLYQGEFWGCTGNDRFHHALYEHCQRQTEIEDALGNTPQWCGIRDRWHAFKKLRNFSRGKKDACN